MEGGARGRRGQGRKSERGRSDVAARVLAAIPAIAFAIFIVSQGGLVFAVGLIALGILAQTELYTMMARVRPVNLAGFVTLVGLVLAALYGTAFHVLLVLVCSVPLTFFLGLLRPRRENVSWAVAVTFLGIMWIGLGVAHAVLLRELPHGGALVLDVLIGTFVGDTCAYFGGRAWGRRRLAPQISPNKTLEGLITGIVGGTVAFWLFAVAYQHEWFKGPDALLIGFCVALAGPVGDLFESMLKRDLDVKDTGRFFGAHGGVLDRLDAVLFTVVTAYYVSRAVLG
jgi:phosphatidate cytidylyltransferase